MRRQTCGILCFSVLVGFGWLQAQTPTPAPAPAAPAAELPREGDMLTFRSAGQPERRVRILRIAGTIDDGVADVQDQTTQARYSVPLRALASMSKTATRSRPTDTPLSHSQPTPPMIVTPNPTSTEERQYRPPYPLPKTNANGWPTQAAPVRTKVATKPLDSRVILPSPTQARALMNDASSLGLPQGEVFQPTQAPQTAALPPVPQDIPAFAPPRHPPELARETNPWPTGEFHTAPAQPRPVATMARNVPSQPTQAGEVVFRPATTTVTQAQATTPPSTAPAPPTEWLLEPTFTRTETKQSTPPPMAAPRVELVASNDMLTPTHTPAATQQPAPQLTTTTTVKPPVMEIKAPEYEAVPVYNYGALSMETSSPSTIPNTTFTERGAVPEPVVTTPPPTAPEVAPLALQPTQPSFSTVKPPVMEIKAPEYEAVPVYSFGTPEPPQPTQPTRELTQQAPITQAQVQPVVVPQAAPPAPAPAPAPTITQTSLSMSSIPTLNMGHELIGTMDMAKMPTVMLEEIQPYLNDLSRALRPSLRERAASALAEGRYGSRPEVKAALARVALFDTAPTVKAHCIRLLSKLGYHESSYLDFLGACAESGNDVVRRNAIDALAKLQPR